MITDDKKLILVIDDSVDNQELIKIILMSKGFKVHCASNGRDALALLKELTFLPDLILLDARMPVMDGFQFRTEQSNSERLKDIPVLVMTADDDFSIILKMKQPCGVLVKPLNLELLVEKVTACL